MGCFLCFKSSEGSKNSCKCWKGKSSKEDKTLRRRKRRGVCCSSKKKESTCCFNCNKSPKDEKSLGERGKCGMGCSCCHGPSKGEDPSKKGGKCGTCCFKCNRNSSKEPSLREGKGLMGCFCCGKPSKKEELRKGKDEDKTCCACVNLSEWAGCSCFFKSRRREDGVTNTSRCLIDSGKQKSPTQEIIRIGNENIAARVFTYRELSESTQNFSPECLLGEGGLGKVYKGQLKSTNQVIAVKKLNRNGDLDNREFLIEVLMLSLLSHPNLINLLGYCAEGDERILVYDYMPLGSLQDHLLDLTPDTKPLDWYTRIKIAAGAAKGLEHLHDTANPPVIFRDLKASNILLDEDYNPRLSDFGLDKLGPVGVKKHISTRVMGTYGYCAPEYALAGKLTVMSNIYSFGVVLLELITGRKAMDSTRPITEQRLVDWAIPRFKDKKNLPQMADPLLGGKFPEKGLYQALAVAAMCTQEEDTTRPLIKDVVSALQFLVEEEPQKDTAENQNTDQTQTETGIEENTADEESVHSSNSEWQSCSTTGDEEEEIKQQDTLS